MVVSLLARFNALVVFVVYEIPVLGAAVRKSVFLFQRDNHRLGHFWSESDIEARLGLYLGNTRSYITAVWYIVSFGA